MQYMHKLLKYNNGTETYVELFNIAVQCHRHEKREHFPYFILSFHTDSYSWLLWKKASWHFRHYYGNQWRYIRYWLTTQNKCIPIHQMQNDMHFHICKPNQSWAQCERSIYKKKKSVSKMRKLNINDRNCTFCEGKTALSGNCLREQKMTDQQWQHMVHMNHNNLSETCRIQMSD